MIDLSLFTIGNLSACLVAGLLAGGYLAAFHPPAIAVPLRRRALLSGWYFAFLGSILYVARLVNGLATGAPDTPRVLGGWILWLLFAGFVAAGAYAGGAWRARRHRAEASARNEGDEHG